MKTQTEAINFPNFPSWTLNTKEKQFSLLISNQLKKSNKTHNFIAPLLSSVLWDTGNQFHPAVGASPHLTPGRGLAQVQKGVPTLPGAGPLALPQYCQRGGSGWKRGSNAALVSRNGDSISVPSCSCHTPLSGLFLPWGLRVPNLPCSFPTAPAAGGGSGSEGAVSPVHYLLQNRPLNSDCRTVGVWEIPFLKAKKKKKKRNKQKT
jgi:hypothetical protein